MFKQTLILAAWLALQLVGASSATPSKPLVVTKFSGEEIKDRPLRGGVDKYGNVKLYTKRDGSIAAYQYVIKDKDGKDVATYEVPIDGNTKQVVIQVGSYLSKIKAGYTMQSGAPTPGYQTSYINLDRLSLDAQENPRLQIEEPDRIMMLFFDKSAFELARPEVASLISLIRLGVDHVKGKDRKIVKAKLSYSSAPDGMRLRIHLYVEDEAGKPERQFILVLDRDSSKFDLRQLQSNLKAVQQMSNNAFKLGSETQILSLTPEGLDKIPAQVVATILTMFRDASFLKPELLKL